MAQTDDFKGVYKAVGISSILAAIFIIITLVSSLVPFEEVGEEVEEDEQRLLRASSNSLLWALQSGSYIIFWLFLIPLFPALYLALRGVQHTYAFIAATVGEVGVIIGLTGAGMFYSVLSLSKSYAAASGVEKTAIVAASQAINASVNVSVSLGFLLIGVALIIVGLAMLKGVFNKGVSGLGIVTGILLLAAAIPFIAALFVVAGLGFIIWLVAVGLRLYKL